jgi:DNA repair exonuclease SbcCD ATPase subunit
MLNQELNKLEASERSTDASTTSAAVNTKSFAPQQLPQDESDSVANDTDLLALFFTDAVDAIKDEILNLSQTNSSLVTELRDLHSRIAKLEDKVQRRADPQEEGPLQALSNKMDSLQDKVQRLADSHEEGQLQALINEEGQLQALSNKMDSLEAKLEKFTDSYEESLLQLKAESKPVLNPVIAKSKGPQEPRDKKQAFGDRTERAKSRVASFIQSELERGNKPNWSLVYRKLNLYKQNAECVAACKALYYDMV